MNYSANYSLYKNNQILDANQGKLILMMYDGAIQFITRAKNKLENNDLGGMGLYLTKAERVISELSNCLKKKEGGDISKSLENLYNFIIKELLLTQVKKDPAVLGRVISILGTLREAWHEIFNKEEPKATSVEKVEGGGIRGHF